MRTISMSRDELNEGRRVGIPEYILGKLARGIVPSEREKEIIMSYGKVYVVAFTTRGGVIVKPQFRNLSGGQRTQRNKSERFVKVRFPKRKMAILSEESAEVIDAGLVGVGDVHLPKYSKFVRTEGDWSIYKYGTETTDVWVEKQMKRIGELFFPVEYEIYSE